jgi:aspartate/methionine/tyrosine aminotransferase
VRFSRRTAWERGSNDLSLLFEQARRRGIVADLTESNPTRAGLAADPRDLAAALSDPGNARYEPDPLGLLPARRVVSSWLLARGIDAAPERIVLTASTSEAYSLLFKLLCDPGDAVMIPQPSYPLFEMLARLDAAEIAPYRLMRADRWRIDVDAIAASLPENARAILVVNPNNPTGSMLSREEAVALATLCRERDLALISDEVFAEFPWAASAAPASLLPIGVEAGALTASLSGLSKACGLPQLKLGWIALGGPDDVVSEALARLELVSDTYLSVATPVQAGVAALLALGDAFRARLMERVRANRAVLARVLEGTNCRALPADAGWNVVLELPEGCDEVELTSTLARAGVLVQPGWFFDMPGDHVVLSLIVDERAFEVGAGRVASLACAARE